MSKRLNVYGIGNAIMDFQLFVTDEEFSGLGLERGSMTLVDSEEQKSLLERFDLKNVNRASGGSAANTIIALAQLGARVGYGCLVANDENGQSYVKEMESLDVEFHTKPTASEETGRCIVLITPDAERTMNTFLGISSQFSAEEISESHIADSDWLYIEGYLFSSEKGRGAVEKAIAFAKEHNTKIAITFSDAFIVDCFGDALSSAVSQADLVFANATEAKAFAKKDDEEEAFRKICEEVPAVVMTMSEKGAWVSMGNTTTKVDSFETKALDDTGAGDMFAGGFLYGISQGYSAETCGKIACFLASKVVSQLGPRLEGDIRKSISGLV
jgi:sugar/nucleoside kinase (ribokinase family)